MRKVLIKFNNVSKKYGENAKAVVSNLSIDIYRNDFVTILGSSGSGKTTVLKMVNRLIEPTSGTIYFDGMDIMMMDINRLRRKMGYVIQQIGLFPHLTVQQNIALLPDCLKEDKVRTRKRVDELLSLVRLDPNEFKFRYPRQLSGGQQQRVGIARALINDPKVLLFDEPFGALDIKTRNELQGEILQIHRELNMTTLFVTHDVQEAFKLGTKIMIINNGVIEKYDTPKNILLSSEEQGNGIFNFGSSIQRLLMLKPSDVATEFSVDDKGIFIDKNVATMEEVVELFVMNSDIQNVILCDNSSPVLTICRSNIM